MYKNIDKQTKLNLKDLVEYQEGQVVSTTYNLERHGQLHLESLFAVYCVRNILGHDQGLALFHIEYFTTNSESALAFQNSHHSITARRMGRDFLTLVKGKDCHAHIVILYQCLSKL